MASTVLIVEDTESLALLYQSYLIPTGLHSTIANTGTEALASIEKEKPELIILDVMLPDMNGMDILRQLPNDNRAKVVVLTANGTKELAIEAVRLGAADFIEKPVDAERFRITVNNALKLNLLSESLEKYQTKYENGRFCDLIGDSEVMQSVYQVIDSAANSKASVFITGESGTGKELCAQAIHQCSERQENPFFALNCAAIPKELMESEIFGHVKGAFTGATHSRNGAAISAHNGTLFLDEVCEMSFELQSKLLRFIQTGTFQQVGSEKLQQVNVRFVCATNRDPWAEVMAGRFREDLYYRLYVIPIEIPPLRERGNDILKIANAFFERISLEENQEFVGLSIEAKRCLEQYHWPGNVRQLENIVRNTIVLNNATIIEADMLPTLIKASNGVETVINNNNNNDSNAKLHQLDSGVLSRQDETPVSQNQVTDFTIEPLHVVEKRYIEAAISMCADNVPKAAAYLEISPSTIYRKMKSW